MKKRNLLSTFIISLCLCNCGPTPASVEEDNPTPVPPMPQVVYEWNEEQLAMFEQYLGGFVIPVVPKEITKFSYFLGSLTIETAFDETIDTTYASLLEEDNYVVEYDSTYGMYSATKNVNEDHYIYLTIYNDREEQTCFQINASYKTKEKDRDHEWTNEEKALFTSTLEGYNLPFPETTHVSIRKTTNFNRDCLWITGDYNKSVLSTYLNTLNTNGFKLSKHPAYDIDVAKIQLTNRRNLELWIAIADETSSGGGKFFEIFAYSHFGVVDVIDDNFVSFGLYPQTEVYGNIYNKLLEQVGTLPTASNYQDWNVYNDFYVEYERKEDGFYKDFTYKGDKYRAYYCLKPRTMTAPQPYNDEFYPYLMEENGYQVRTVYFFKFEPIIWEKMKTSEGITTLAPVSVLDINYYTVKEDAYVENEETIYQLNYEHSFIRSFINNEFFNTAFSEEEKEMIQTTSVDNTIEQSCPTEGELSLAASNATDFGVDNTKFFSPNTEDKVFLFSRKELLDLDFGYGTVSNWTNIDYEKACKTSTDYAKARGALIAYDFKNTIYNGTTKFYTRSPLACSVYGNHVFISNEYHGIEYSYTNPVQALGVYPGINVKF